MRPRNQGSVGLKVWNTAQDPLKTALLPGRIEVRKIKSPIYTDVEKRNNRRNRRCLGVFKKVLRN